MHFNTTGFPMNTVITLQSLVWLHGSYMKGACGIMFSCVTFQEIVLNCYSI